MADMPPSFREALPVWARIGMLSFGGPAGQIALMHRELVETLGWLSETRFLAALNFCMLLPGPEAMQLATYAGWRMHGVAGGLAAGLLFVLPGAALMLALGLLYAAYGAQPFAEALFVGVKAAVLIIVVEALVRVSRRALRSPLDWLIAMSAFVAIFALHVPFPIVVLVALAVGYLSAQPSREAFVDDAPVPVAFKETLKTVVIWLAIWIVPLLLVAAAVGPSHVLSQLALFYGKLAVVTFGGAYAVLTYMAQQVVDAFGWLSPGEMLDALGLAETTPGPLILVTEFVGILAAWRHGGDWPLVMGVLGAFVTLWATFAPCFLWIFAGAPYIDWLTREPRLAGALRAVTAAVVGVILNLTLWFGLHALFGDVTKVQIGPLSPALPVLSSFQPVVGALALVALVVVLATQSILAGLAICAGVSVIVSQLL